tara:strand:- start:1120 stop:1251 length:132 start_codon:yes stop_codon:yes gene_type:complete
LTPTFHNELVHTQKELRDNQPLYTEHMVEERQTRRRRLVNAAG